MSDWLTKYVNSEVGIGIVVMLFCVGLFLMILGMLGGATSNFYMKDASEDSYLDLQARKKFSQRFTSVGVAFFIAGVIAYVILPR